LPRLDLHIHSTASDGVHSPSRIVDMAGGVSLYMISVTDHDTFDGIHEGAAAASKWETIFIPGIELSVDLEPLRKDSAHLLGYFPGVPAEVLVNPSSYLAKAVEYVQEGRRKRNPRILEKLGGLGMNLSVDHVSRIAGGKVLGRPHIAQAMVELGYVGSIQEAFNRYLKKGRAAYVERERLSMGEAIELIRGAGGLPVLAHPGYISQDGNTLKLLIAALKRKGLAGVEAYYPAHSASMVRFLSRLSGELDLLVTGGTDYHGRKDDIPVGGGDVFKVEKRDVMEFSRICEDAVNREV